MCIRDRRDEAIRTVGIERQNADRQMNEEKNNAAYQIRQVRDQAVSYTHLDVYKRQDIYYAKRW